MGRCDRVLGQWQPVDSTLRSLVAAACSPDTVTAVGAFGRVVFVDDLAKTIHADDIGLFNAYAVSLLPDGALVVGSDGSVQRQSSVGWDKFAEGIDEDLYGVVGFAGGSAWMVGAGGVTYRLAQIGRESGTKTARGGRCWAPRPVGALGRWRLAPAGRGGTGGCGAPISVRTS